jgi:hypothetical protein
MLFFGLTQVIMNPEPSKSKIPQNHPSRKELKDEYREAIYLFATAKFDLAPLIVSLVDDNDFHPDIIILPSDTPQGDSNLKVFNAFRRLIGLGSGEWLEYTRTSNLAQDAQTREALGMPVDLVNQIQKESTYDGNLIVYCPLSAVSDTPIPEATVSDSLLSKTFRELKAIQQKLKVNGRISIIVIGNPEVSQTLVSEFIQNSSKSEFINKELNNNFEVTEQDRDIFKKEPFDPFDSFLISIKKNGDYQLRFRYKIYTVSNSNTLN